MLFRSQEFEKAHYVKEKLDLLDKYQSRSTVVNPSINNVDVFSISTTGLLGYVNFMKVMNGAIIQVHTIEMVKKLDETPEELLEIAITEIRQRFESVSPEIIVPFPMEYEIPGVSHGLIWEIRGPRTARDFAPIFDAIGAKYPEQREVVFPRHSRFVLMEAQRKLTLLRGGQRLRVPYLVFEEA